MIVVDASVVVDALLGRPQAASALGDAVERLGLAVAPLAAPELLELEVLNTLRKFAARDAGAADRARLAFIELRLRLFPHRVVRERVWDLRAELTAYDAAYLALAEVLDSPLLVTCDRGLGQRARRHLGTTRVLLVPG